MKSGRSIVAKRHPYLVAALLALGTLALVGITPAAQAQEAGAVLRAIDAQGGSIIVKKATGELAELRVVAGATITLDGKPAGLDALKPGLKVVGLDVDGDGSVRSLGVVGEPVRLRIAIGKEGDCRVIVGRSMPQAVRPADGLVPITTSYASSFVGEVAAASERRDSSRFVPAVPRFAKSSSMLLYPRAFRLPCILTLDIAELRDGSVGVQFITPSSNVVVYVESEDGLREKAKVIAVAVANYGGGRGNPPGVPEKRVKVEQPVDLSHPEELVFKLPLSARQLGDLFTIDAVLRARPGRDSPRPAVEIRNASLLGGGERTLGMDLGVKEGMVVVERVEPEGLASRAGIRAGDAIVAIDGGKIPALEDAGGLTLAFEFGVRTKIVLTLVRGGKEQTATIEFE